MVALEVVHMASKYAHLMARLQERENEVIAAKAMVESLQAPTKGPHPRLICTMDELMAARHVLVQEAKRRRG